VIDEFERRDAILAYFQSVPRHSRKITEEKPTSCFGITSFRPGKGTTSFGIPAYILLPNFGKLHYNRPREFLSQIFLIRVHEFTQIYFLAICSNYA